MRLVATLEGADDFRRAMGAQRAGRLRAAISGVRRTGEDVKRTMRADVSRTVDSRRAAFAVRSRVHENVESGAPRAVVWSNWGRGRGAGFKDILALHLFGGAIGPRKGKWLFIPWTAQGQRSGRRHTATTRKRGMALLAQGKLDFVPIRGNRVALLVHRTRTRSRIYFVLVRRSTYKAVVAPGAYAAAARRDLPDNVRRAWRGMALGGR